ncbi:MAG TPA: hypothetical protein VGM88_06145 [Kofleriaceae bacterium]|jgi:hypothetical protein
MRHRAESLPAVSSGRPFVAAFAQLAGIADPAERLRVARQGLAAIAQLAEREPAPLEGIDAELLLAAVRTATADGVLGELGWLSPAAAAIALFELAQALPPGPERRELGRRVLVRLRDADRETFVRLLVALARSAPRSLTADALRARTEVILAAPLTGPGRVGELALALLAQPTLAQSWIEAPATGALPGRRLAARMLAHGAREAVRRLGGGDRGGVTVLARPGLRAALARLLGDREALVWRFASIARGLLAHADSELADQIDRELRATASSTELRRAAASAAAALERGGAAARWTPELVARAQKEPAVARGAILGLAGLAISAPTDADDLAQQLVARAPLEAAESLADLRREEASPLLPGATAAALAWTRAQLAGSGADARDGSAEPRSVAEGQRGASDDGRAALLHALEQELAADPRATSATELGAPLAAARAALDAGDAAAALRHARAAVDEVAAAADWLERATDSDPLDRRHSLRLLRELDRELLADNTLGAVIALAPDADPVRAQLHAALASIEHALLARESEPEPGPVPHGGLRIARLRALVRFLDGMRETTDADLAPRLAAVRRLMGRAALDQSPLRRAVWAALTRAGDALLRDEQAEVTDLLLVWSRAFPDDDFAIVREASMVPAVEAAFDAYARLHQATWAAADPDDTDAIRAVAFAIGDLADALPPEQSPRVESVRLALARLGTQLVRISSAGSHASLPAGAFAALATELGALARRTAGAHARLGVELTDPGTELETATRAIGGALGRHAPAGAADEPMAVAIDAARASLPPAIAAALERILAWLARRPATDEEAAPSSSPASDAELPSWVPLSRLLGAFYVVRALGRGAGGSVLLAVRADERTRADRELVALKVPEYGGSAAQQLSETEFEALFREEAGALLALPAHDNLARFVTFDASARPKPILVMEWVRGPTLERALEGTLDLPRAFAIIDGLLAGLDAMHGVQIAHLDVKPANVILRDGVAVLVDFGLAGRRLRAGCGSVHYGAAEVWLARQTMPPFAADVYAAACVAYELLANQVLVGGESVKEVVDQHLSKTPGAAPLAALERDPRLRPLAELLRAAVSRDASRRPTAARLRAGFAAISPDLRGLSWPLAP